MFEVGIGDRRRQRRMIPTTTRSAPIKPPTAPPTTAAMGIEDTSFVDRGRAPAVGDGVVMEVRTPKGSLFMMVVFVLCVDNEEVGKLGRVAEADVEAERGGSELVAEVSPVLVGVDMISKKSSQTNPAVPGFTARTICGPSLRLGGERYISTW